ncbi:zinc finger protein 569-like [Anopheles moucheti]|uniref:zinc finger protein 569-like n=1 Tax=Anopheles moucheti TaxID=186751 RepID=UPI0022F1426E|nr:zinc finger protein 569-like [Anopheles moucheti]
METGNGICRMCLVSCKKMCPLFDSSANSELLGIIRNTVRLQIDEDDKFSKMICKQCISRLKSIDEHVKLFHASDRKLRGAISTDHGHDLEVERLKMDFSPNAVDESQGVDGTVTSSKRYDYEKNESAKTETESTRRSLRIRTRCNQSDNHQEEETDDEASAKEEIDCDNENTDSTFKPKVENATFAQLVVKCTISNSEPKTKRQKKNTNLRQTNRAVKDLSNARVPMLHDFKCYICSSEPLGSRKALIEHLATHVDKVPYTCKRCVMETIVLTRVRTLNTHMKMHEQPIKCDYCDRRYSNAAGKYYHTHTYHLGGGAPCIVHCKICGKQYGSQAALKQHMKYHTTTLKCSKCDMVFNHPNKRRNHELTHNEDRGYECVVCKKVLQTIESYDVHLKKHSQERSYQCTLCPKKFNTSFNLILHLKVHAKNYNYRPAKSWVEHYTILSRNPMQYKCNHCERYSTDKVNNMISHLQAHFKEYECDQCKRLFATGKQLRAHYTTHTGEKSEMCQHCGKCFSTKNNLRIHIKSHERENGEVRNGSLLPTAHDYPPEPCIEIEAVSNSTNIS